MEANNGRCWRVLQKWFEWWRLRRFELMAVGFGLAAAWALFAYLSGLQQTELVLQATRDLPPGWRLTPSDVEIRAIPRGAGHPLSLRDPIEAEGYVLVTRILKGQAVLLPDVSSPGVGGALSVQLAVGERALFIPWPAGAGYGIEPGDWVDLVAVWDRFESNSGAEPITPARVLQISDGDFGGGGLTVAIPASAAGYVVTALEKGSLHPVLRPLTEP